jgi:hypothetical protein
MVTVDDKPDPKSPDGPGSRDDPSQTVAHTMKVRFPASVEGGLTGDVVQEVGQAWHQLSTWTVKDQFGVPLSGVSVSENPTMMCTTVSPHNPADHMEGYVILGNATTYANGQFTDTFGAGAGVGTGRACTKHQHYSVHYGSWSCSPPHTYRVKIINYRPEPQVVIDQSGGGWTYNQMSCTFND